MGFVFLYKIGQQYYNFFNGFGYEAIIKSVKICEIIRGEMLNVCQAPTRHNEMK